MMKQLSRMCETLDFTLRITTNKQAKAGDTADIFHVFSSYPPFPRRPGQNSWALLGTGDNCSISTDQLSASKENILETEQQQPKSHFHK